MIRAEGVTGQYFTSRAKMKSAKGVEENSDFESVLKKQNVEKSDMKLETEDAESIEESGTIDEMDDKKFDADAKGVAEKQKPTVESADKKQDSGELSKGEEFQEAEMPEELVAEVAAKLNVMFGNIVQMISEYTGKSIEEIKEMMISLDLQPQNLMDNGNINQLVANLMGKTDVMQLLTDSELSSMMKDLIVAVNEEKQGVFGQLQMNAEDVVSFLENVEQSEESVAGSVLEDISKDVDGMSVEEQEQPVQDVKQTGNMNFKDSSETDDFKEDDSATAQVKSYVEKSEVKTDNQEITTGMAGVVENLRAAVEEVLPEENRSTVVNRIMNQVIDNIRTQATPDMKSLELQLEPENLGKVTISIVSKSGYVTAEIAAQTQVAKEAIESQLAILKENLQQQGIKVESVEVTIASHSFEQNLEKGNESNSEGQNGRRQRRVLVEDVNGESQFVTEEENLEESVLEDLGTKVSYLA